MKVPRLLATAGAGLGEAEPERDRRFVANECTLSELSGVFVCDEPPITRAASGGTCPLAIMPLMVVMVSWFPGVSNDTPPLPRSP